MFGICTINLTLNRPRKERFCYLSKNLGTDLKTILLDHQK